MPAGQPTKYDPSYCDLIIEHMKSGKTKIEFAADLNISNKTLYNWRDANPEFLHAMEIGEMHLKKWWLETGRGALFDTSLVETSLDGSVTKSFSKISPKMFELYMHNLFGWNKKEVDKSKDAPNTELTQEVKDMAKRMLNERS